MMASLKARAESVDTRYDKMEQHFSGLEAKDNALCEVLEMFATKFEGVFTQKLLVVHNRMFRDI